MTKQEGLERHASITTKILGNRPASTPAVLIDTGRGTEDTDKAGESQCSLEQGDIGEEDINGKCPHLQPLY